MTNEQYLEFIDALMEQENKCLNTEQREIIKGVLEGQTYEQILTNKKIPMNLTNIKKNMSKKVYPVLTNVLRKKYGSSIKVGKKNLVSILDSYYKKYKKEQQSAPLANPLQINNLKLEILNKLENHIKQWTLEKKESYSELIKIYWLELNEEIINKIDNKNLERLFELLIDQETSTIIRILTSITQDEEVEKNIRNWFETIIEELKQVLTISEEDFQRWKVNPIRPDRIDMIKTPNISSDLTYTEHCLILKIKTSDNKSVSNAVNSGQYAIEDAYFLPDVPYPPNKADYIPLNEEIQEYKNKKIEQKQQKEYYSIEELKPLLTKLIHRSTQFPVQRTESLTIYFFCEKVLLSTNFDCWPSELLPGYKLKNLYQIRVRCLERLNSMYIQSKCKQKWYQKWFFAQQQFNVSGEGETWKNLCRSNLKDLNSLLITVLGKGIPIAIWSRYHQKSQDHFQEINNLVLNCEGNLQNLPEIIENTRDIDPDEDDDLENLGHHLSLLWEDPNLIPPFARLTS